MDPITTIYVILGILIFFALVVILIVIAGRDIYFAFARRFIPKGSDIFVLNNNRHVDRHYKTAKDGVFTIKKVPYLTNPNKVMGLDDKMAEKVRKSMDRSLKALQKRIDKLNEKKKKLVETLDSLKDTPVTEAQRATLGQQIANLDNKITILESKKEKREQAYIHNRRSCYFFIENDPVPKDLFEWYTELDSVQLDNVIVRVQTKDPRNLKDLEKAIVWIKRFILFALIAAGVAAWFAFNNNSAITQIADSVGVTLTI